MPVAAKPLPPPPYNAEAAGIGDHGALEAVARREAVLVGLLVVDFDVERILVLAARGGAGVVIGQVVVDVRQRDEVEQLLRDRADLRGRESCCRRRAVRPSAGDRGRRWRDRRRRARVWLLKSPARNAAGGTVMM